MIRRRIVECGPSEAAVKLGRHLTTIYRRLLSRRMAAIKEGHEWRIFLLEVTQEGSDPRYYPLQYEALNDILGPELRHITKEE